MAKQQTFIILCWYGAETYEEALKREDKVDEKYYLSQAQVDKILFA